MHTAADFASRTMTDPGLRAFIERHSPSGLASWPVAEWDFTNLVWAAFYYHPDLDVARAQWAVVQAGKITAAERPNPTLSASPSYNTTTAVPSPWLVTSALDIPIETAGKRGYRLAQAAHLSEVARLNIASVAWQVRSRLRTRLAGLFVAQETVRLLRQQQTVQAENVRILEGQVQAGAISAFEATQGRIASDTTQLALREAERQQAEARVQLADAVGVPVGAIENVRFSFPDLNELPAEASLADARRQALLHRADILGVLAEYAASQSALQLQIARQYPDVHLSPGYEFDQGDNKWSLGLSLTLPVLNHNQGAIAEAEAKRREIAARFNALQARVLGEIDQAIAGYHLARAKQTDADALLGRLRQQEKAAQAIFGAGEISRGDLNALDLQLSAAALARLEALAKSQQAFGQLEDALQSPLGIPAAIEQEPSRTTFTGQRNSLP